MEKVCFLKTYFVLIFSLYTYSICFGQSRQPELVGRDRDPSRVKKPVLVEVEAGNDRVTFFGVNNSFIPYQLELEFTQLSNLEPETKYYKIIINHGRTQLFDLRIRQKNIAPTYRYRTWDFMGDPASRPDADFPYLVPIARDKKVNAVDLPAMVKGPVLLMLSAGDTLYAMRKGKVTATPENNTEIDRLTPLSLEVYHHDGTVASYHASKSKSLVREDDLVYPGQPIAVILQGGPITVCVYRFFPDRQIAPIEVGYSVNGTSLLKPDHLNGVTVAHPVEIIRKELTESERMKWQKGSLYK